MKVNPLVAHADLRKLELIRAGCVLLLTPCGRRLFGSKDENGIANVRVGVVNVNEANQEHVGYLLHLMSNYIIWKRDFQRSLC